MKTLKLSEIRIDGGTQSRVAIDNELIKDYAYALTEGAHFPAAVVFFDGADNWLVDGFHRFHASSSIGALSMECEVHQGTQRDAILYSLKVNDSHGLRRSNADKKKAALTLLNDAEWSQWSNREIAKKCGVSSTFIDHIRASLQTVCSEKPTERTYTTKHGTETTMKTSNIGKQVTDIVAAIQSGEIATPKPQPEVEPVTTVAPQATVDYASLMAAHTELQAKYDALVEAHNLLSDQFKGTLADNNAMGKVFDADDQLAAAMKEINIFRSVADHAERQLQEKQSEFIARAQAVKTWQNRAERAEKKLEKLSKVEA